METRAVSGIQGCVIQSRDIQNTKRRDGGGTLSDAIATATVGLCDATIVEHLSGLHLKSPLNAAYGIPIHYSSTQTPSSPLPTLVPPLVLRALPPVFIFTPLGGYRCGRYCQMPRFRLFRS
eukprot:Gb_24956 [translate_table: standard]